MEDEMHLLSDGSDSSDTTAEIEVMAVTDSEEHVSPESPENQAPDSSGQPLSPSSTSPPLNAATPGPSVVISESSSLTSRSLDQTTAPRSSPEAITRLACTIRYLWHLLRQHERNDNFNPATVRFWATRYSALFKHTNGCNFGPDCEYQRQRRTADLSTSTSEDLRSLIVEPSSDDESTDMNVDPLVVREEEQDEYETSVKEKSDTDDEKSHLIQTKASSGSSENADEENEPEASLDQIRIQDEEQSEDSFLLEFAEPIASTSQAVFNPISDQRRMVKKQARRGGQDSKQGVISGVVRIVVPTAKVGRIIGKGGREIKEIERKTGANITIESHKSKKPATDITVRGTSEAIAAAHQAIRDLIQNYKQHDTGEH